MIVEPDPEKAFEYSNPCFGQIGFLQHTCCLIRECSWHRIPLVRQIRFQNLKICCSFLPGLQDCTWLSNLQSSYPSPHPSIHHTYACCLSMRPRYLWMFSTMCFTYAYHSYMQLCNMHVYLSINLSTYQLTPLENLSCWTAPWGLPKTGSLQVWQIASNFFLNHHCSCSLQVQNYVF